MPLDPSVETLLNVGDCQEWKVVRDELFEVNRMAMIPYGKKKVAFLTTIKMKKAVFDTNGQDLVISLSPQTMKLLVKGKVFFFLKRFDQAWHQLSNK